MLASDLFGGAGALLLAIPALKDQFYRFNREAQSRREASSPWPGLRKAAKDAWEERRNDYDGVDSLMTAAGAVGLVLAFLLKLFDA
ncbi:MAG TPA: hypothetical protein VGI79_18225 [Caulobacteraceae bacterium]|jgi:hypothetical protein